MPLGLLEQIYALNRAGESFAVASVVRVDKPISAKPGDKAISRGDRAGAAASARGRVPYIAARNSIFALQCKEQFGKIQRQA